MVVQTCWPNREAEEQGRRSVLVYLNEIALPELGLEFGVDMFNEASTSPGAILIQILWLKKLTTIP